jgi:hypothetical protein
VLNLCLDNSGKLVYSGAIMIANQRNLFLGVPKCGSQTAKIILQGQVVSSPTNPHPLYENIQGEFDNVYAFWRDPVERFISATKFLIECEEEGRVFDPRELITRFTNDSQANRFILYKHQSDWYKNVPNLTILHFSEYDTHIRTLQEIFGVKALDGNIPRAHRTSVSLTVDEDVKEMIRDYYREDYDYEPVQGL